VPPGYETADEAAPRLKIGARMLKRRLARGEVPGARKVPHRGKEVWILPTDATLAPLPTGRPPKRGRPLSEDERRTLAARAHAGENRSALAREYGIDRSHVYWLMSRYGS
jgi:hypothetical protein